MAMKVINTLQEEALTQLSRAELQALGKTHNVKANLKSINIIAHLLKIFPDGVPNPNASSAPKTKRKGRAKKAGGNKKKTQIKREESVAASITFSNRDNDVQGQASPSPLHNSLTAAEKQPTQSISPSPKRRTTRALSGAVPSAEHLSRERLRSPAQDSPVPTEIVASPVRTEPMTKPPQKPAFESELEGEGSKTSHVEIVGEDEVDMDNLSEVSDITHNPSQSSRGSSPQPLANDATLKYVVDIIKANEEKDQQMRDEIKRLQERATKAKKLLEEQYYLLNAEREHRDRIMTFLLYNVRNNNRWIGQSVNADQLEAAVLKEMVSNGGRGWRDMGEWEYGEVWSGPMVVSESNIEITASNLDEYLRDMWDIHQRARMEGNTAENEDDTRSADPPSAPDILSNTPADLIDTSAPLSRKRKISCPPLSEHEDQPTEKRLRLSPIVEDSLTVNPTHPHPSPPSIVRKNKGKGRMTSLEVEQLQRQQAREKRVRSMKELDEDDSADTYEIQVALADSLLQSAGETAMDQ